MHKLFIIGLTIILTGLATTAMAERGNVYDGYSAGRDRGDRIEARFDRKADLAAAHGQYRKAYRLKEKGERINRRLDYKHKGYGGRYAAHWKQHHKHRAGCALPRHHRYGDRLRLGVFVPGFWFSGVWHD